MYRDRSTDLDEHDRAVGAIQIADAVLADCTRFAARLAGPERPERSDAARSLHELYPEIWLQLDSARKLLAARGANTTGYDELRADVVPVLPVRDRIDEIDRAVLDDARRAIEELRLAVPGADWNGIEERTRGLLGTKLAMRGGRLKLVGVITAFALAVATWAAASVPEEQPDPDAELQLELARVIDERAARIEALQVSLRDTCNPPRDAYELMRLLVEDARYEDARVYAADYTARCGENLVVLQWAKLAKPRRTE